MVSFGRSTTLNSTSFHSTLNGKWRAAYKTSRENVKLIGRGLLVLQAGLLSSLLCVRPFIVSIQSEPLRN